METRTRRLSQSCVLSLHDIPHEGLDLEFQMKFSDLYRSHEQEMMAEDQLSDSFSETVKVSGSIFKVASKVDLRGSVASDYRSTCDRCNRDVILPLKAKLDMFLMAKTQFSDHDKPGGKVIHGKANNQKPSRHHSHSKAEFLSDAEGEHEDESFGAFDGQTVDLRPLIRELLVLQIPMRLLCNENCRGLCVHCGGNIDDQKCQCSGGPTEVDRETREGSESILGQALKARLSE